MSPKKISEKHSGNKKKIIDRVEEGNNWKSWKRSACSGLKKHIDNVYLFC